MDVSGEQRRLLELVDRERQTIEDFYRELGGSPASGAKRPLARAARLIADRPAGGKHRPANASAPRDAQGAGPPQCGTHRDTRDLQRSHGAPRRRSRGRHSSAASKAMVAWTARGNRHERRHGGDDHGLLGLAARGRKIAATSSCSPSEPLQGGEEPARRCAKACWVPAPSSRADGPARPTASADLDLTIHVAGRAAHTTRSTSASTRSSAPCAGRPRRHGTAHAAGEPMAATPIANVAMVSGGGRQPVPESAGDVDIQLSTGAKAEDVMRDVERAIDDAFDDATIPRHVEPRRPVQSRALAELIDDHRSCARGRRARHGYRRAQPPLHPPGVAAHAHFNRWRAATRTGWARWIATCTMSTSASTSTSSRSTRTARRR